MVEVFVRSSSMPCDVNSDPLKDPTNGTPLIIPSFPNVVLGPCWGGSIFWIL